MAPLQTVTPAVTCSVQASFMTGLKPSAHGIVGNGWLFRDQMEVMLWRQSNRLVEGEKIAVIEHIDSGEPAEAGVRLAAEQQRHEQQRHEHPRRP